MLIIPIENKPDWSRPPWVTLLLIVLNVLVFVFYQSDDESKAELAYDIYTSNNLLEREKPYYLDFLQKSDAEFLRFIEGLDETTDQDGWLIYGVVHDPGFDSYLREIWQREAPANVDTWREARIEFEQQRDRMSSLQAGLVPAKVIEKPWTLISSQFLHGGWGHLLGNMVFLFLFGFALEAFLRPLLYITLYLVSGLAACLLYMAFSTHVHVPLVGASGAVSGLMGMYIALYRLRRIRFFYSVGFYFGEFVAPALWVFPVWLAKELYGHFFTDTNIAYWAHIGGLLAGAGMMLLVPGVQKTFQQKTAVDETEQAIVAGLAQIQRQTAELNIARARVLAQGLCERFADDPRPRQVLFDLYKSASKSREFHRHTFSLLKHWAGDPQLHWQPMVVQVLDEYRALTPAAPALTAPLCVALGHRFLADKNYRQAEAFAQLAGDRGANASARMTLLKALHSHYQAVGKSASVKRMATHIRQLQQQTPTSSQVS